MEKQRRSGRPRLYDGPPIRKAIQIRNPETYRMLVQAVARKAVMTGRTPIRENEVIHDGLRVLLRAYDRRDAQNAAAAKEAEAQAKYPVGMALVRTPEAVG